MMKINCTYPRFNKRKVSMEVAMITVHTRIFILKNFRQKDSNSYLQIHTHLAMQSFAMSVSPSLWYRTAASARGPGSPQRKEARRPFK